MYFFYLLLGSPMANCICYLYDPHFSWNIVANCKFERKTRALSWQKKVMGAGRYTNVCPSEIISVLFLYLACIYISYTFNHPLTLVSDYLFWISYLFLEKRGLRTLERTLSLRILNRTLSLTGVSLGIKS